MWRLQKSYGESVRQRISCIWNRCNQFVVSIGVRDIIRCFIRRIYLIIPRVFLTEEREVQLENVIHPGPSLVRQNSVPSFCPKCMKVVKNALLRSLIAFLYSSVNYVFYLAHVEEDVLDIASVAKPCKRVMNI